LVQVDTDNIEAFVIIEADNFNTTVHQLQQDAGLLPSCTNNEIHVAAAKTLAIRGDKQIINTIVFRDDFMAAIVWDNMENNAWPVQSEEAQLSFYILAHEVGHTKDNTLRSLSDSNEPQLKTPFRIDNLAEYYSPILLSELAACVHSAPAMAANAYVQETKNWHDDVAQYLVRLKKSWWAYQQNNELLQELAFDAAQAFWVMLIQYAKLVGSRIGNPTLPDFEPNLSRDVLIVMKEAAASIRQVWELYPNWTDPPDDILLAYWQKLAGSYGYRFVRSQAGDALYLDNLIIERS
jgi:hypothetical protein